MKNEELKLQSIEKINKAIKILSDNNEKVTYKRISEISGVSQATIKRYKVSPSSEKVSPASKKTSAKTEKVSPKSEKVSPVIEKLKQQMKKVSPKVSPSEQVSPSLEPERFKPLKPSKAYSSEFNKFLIRCIKDPNIPSAYMTKEELKEWEND